MRSRFTLYFVLFSIVLLLVPAAILAQPNVTLRPFVMAGEIRGDVKTDGVDSDFSQGLGNTFEKGNGAVGVDVEIHGDSLSGLSQLWFTSLSDTNTSPTLPDVDAAEQTIAATFFTQTFGLPLYSNGRSFIDLTFGGRLASVENSLTIRSKGLESEVSDSQMWVDPVVGANSNLALSDSVSFRLGGDIGGFTAASDATWQGWGSVGVRLTDRASLAAGYRAISHSFTENEFSYNVTMRGPTLGLDISF